MTHEELFLKRDFDTLYTQNEAFIYYMCKHYFNLGIEYDELVGCANLAFVKCLKTFNPAVSKWLTYFSKAINNEILMLNRKQKKYQGTISLQAILSQDQDGNTLTLEETICSEVAMADEVIDEIATREVYALIEELGKFQKEVINLRLQGKKQEEIAGALGITQSCVSRVIASSKLKLMKLYKKGA